MKVCFIDQICMGSLWDKIHSYSYHICLLGISRAVTFCVSHILWQQCKTLCHNNLNLIFLYNICCCLEKPNILQRFDGSSCDLPIQIVIIINCYQSSGNCVAHSWFLNFGLCLRNVKEWICCDETIWLTKDNRTGLILIYHYLMVTLLLLVNLFEI